jgi:hypothetical protein
MLGTQQPEEQTGTVAERGAVPAYVIRPRAFLVGVLLIPPTAYWVVMMEFIRYSGHPTTISLFFNAIFTLLVLMAVNYPLQRWRPAWALSQAELLVIYSMVCIGSSIAGHDMFQVLVPILAQPLESVTPANRWDQLFFHYLPPGMTVTDTGAVHGFYRGLTSVYRWRYLRAWAQPMLWWGGFAFALLAAMQCINALLRRRWMEEERLSYPITVLPLQITEPGGAVFRSGPMWAGFAVAAAIDLLNGLSALHPTVPHLPITRGEFDAGQYFQRPPWDIFGGVGIAFYPCVIGIGLLLPNDLVLSCWLFYWLWQFERFVGHLTGWRDVPDFPFTAEQSWGAYVALALISLWTGRRHLRHVLDVILGLRRDAAMRTEPMHYRTAAVGLVLAVGALGWIAHRSGMAWWVVPLFFLLYFLVVIAITRIRAELGPPVHDLHFMGPGLTLTKMLGTAPSRLPPQTLVSFSFGYWFNRAYRGLPMANQLEAFKLARESGSSMRAHAAGLWLAALVGVPAGFWAMLHCCYRWGAATKAGFGWEPWNRLVGWLQNPELTSKPAVGAMALGFAAAVGLMAMRFRFAWWPLHPVGFAISGNWSMNLVWLPLFIAWAIKAVVFRYAGMNGYRRVAPFGMGLILGDFLVGGWWCIYGTIRGVATYAFWY